MWNASQFSMSPKARLNFSPVWTAGYPSHILERGINDLTRFRNFFETPGRTTYIHTFRLHFYLISRLYHVNTTVHQNIWQINANYRSRSFSPLTNIALSWKLRPQINTHITGGKVPVVHDRCAVVCCWLSI